MTHYVLNTNNLIRDYQNDLKKNHLYLMVVEEYQIPVIFIDNIRDTLRDKTHVPFYTFDYVYGNEMRNGEIERPCIPHYIEFPLEITVVRLYEEGENETGIRIYKV